MEGKTNSWDRLLNGERRAAKCQESVACTNNNCPMFQVHNITNEASFSWSTLEGSYQCANCLHFSERQWCGALRASKWDREGNIMTVWHHGKHICLLKKPPLEKDDAMKMVTMLKNVLQLHPCVENTMNGFGQSVSLGVGGSII